MGRPQNPVPTERLVITATPKLLQYLDDLVLEQGHGNSRAAVAERLVWRGIEDLISRKLLDRRKGTEGE